MLSLRVSLGCLLLGALAPISEEVLQEGQNTMNKDEAEQTGKYLQFAFYLDKPKNGLITASEADRLQLGLIAWLREQGYGYDGSTHLGNEWGGERHLVAVG